MLKTPRLLAATLSRHPCSMQSSGRQQRVKASTSNISLGDNRIPTFATSYGRDFHAPFETSIRRRARNAWMVYDSTRCWRVAPCLHVIVAFAGHR